MRKSSNIFSASCFRHEQGHSMPRQMGLRMLAVKKRRETGLCMPSTCGFRTTKSRQFEQYKISMHKVSRGARVAGIYGLLREERWQDGAVWCIGLCFSALLEDAVTLYSFRKSPPPLDEILNQIKEKCQARGSSTLELFLICPSCSVIRTRSPWTHLPVLSSSVKNNRVYSRWAWQTTQRYGACLQL